jgi:hypothetical protein
VEIPFRGTGWVYLGELESRRGIAYDSRRLDPEGQSFVFRAESPGTYGLKFYRQDFVHDYILNDHVQVVVEEVPRISSRPVPPQEPARVVAEPRWPSVEEEAAARERELMNIPSLTPSAGVGAVPARPSSSGSQAVPPGRRPELSPGVPSGRDPAPEPPLSREDREGEELSPQIFMDRAWGEMNAGRVSGALSALGELRERFPSGTDEAWWLYGQALEARGPDQDIRAALDYYRRLVRDYPQSRWYAEARRRIAYLERYYINIQ